MARHQGRRRRKGAVVIEFALVVPFLCLIVIGIIDFSRAYSQLNTVNASLREAARYGSALSRPDTLHAAIKGEAVRFSSTFGRAMAPADIQVYSDADSVRVWVTDYPITLPTLGPFLRVAGLETLYVDRAATFRWERVGAP